MIKPARHVEKMMPYVLADLEAPEGVHLVSMAQNESLRPPSPKAVEAAAGALKNVAEYPDPDWNELRLAIAKVHNIPAENILCGAGSMELIACITQAYLEPGTRALSTQYGYAFFKTATQFANAGYIQAAETGLMVSVDALVETVTADTKVVFVANPGNPTGTRISNTELVRLRELLPDNILLVIDEAYGEFSDGIDPPVFDLIDRGNTIVLRTFSKAYGLAGMRVGWGLFPSDILSEVRKLLNPNNISFASQAAATAAMLDQPYMKETCKLTAQIRDKFIGDLGKTGIVTDKSFTNFSLLQFQNATLAGQAFGALREEGIVMRNMAGYGLGNCLRATIAGENEMQRAAEILKNLEEFQ